MEENEGREDGDCSSSTDEGSGTSMAPETRAAAVIAEMQDLRSTSQANTRRETKSQLVSGSEVNERGRFNRRKR